MKIDTLITKTGEQFKNHNGSMNPPVHHQSTILFSTLQEYRDAKDGNSVYTNIEGRDCSYARSGNPTAHELEKTLASLETDHDIQTNGIKQCKSLLYPSGLISLSLTSIAFANATQHILVPNNIYPCFKTFIDTELRKTGVEITFYNPKINLKHIIKHNTSLIIMESPSSFTFEIIDIESVVQLAKENNIVTMMDNTWATPLFFKPLEHGIDISLYSATKYINGHSDVLMGVTHSTGEISDRLYQIYKNYGVTINAQDCYLVHRGLRTLPLRIERHQKNAIKVAQYLKRRPEVRKVLYPALHCSDQHELWKKYYTGATSLFSIVLDKKYSNKQLGHMINHMNLFAIGASWGGYKSLILTFHLDDYIIDGIQEKVTCIRIYCGLEDPEDLILDLDKAFLRLKKTC